MKRRNALRILVASTCVALGLAMPAPVSAAPSDVARLAAVGIDISKYKPGWKIVGNEVHWDSDQVVLSMEPMLIGECPSGWVCLFENAHFDDWNLDGIDDGARMLRFSATGRWIKMSDWNFNDKMSSWYNRRGYDARWYHNAWPQDPLPAICMDAGGRDSYSYGEFNNDKMSMLWIYTSSAVC
jgi:hypothetical protein